MIGRYSLYIFMAITLLSAIGVVTIKNIFRGALLLGLSLLSIAGLYLLMGAEFLAAVQVLVYIGGILTLIIFAVMFTKDLSNKTIQPANNQKGIAFLISASIFAIMICAISQLNLTNSVGPIKIVDAASIGRILFLNYVLAFEVLSVLLLIALVGAIILARKEETDD